jgi:uncharacterized repeat protein (TIGR03803 family)
VLTAPASHAAHGIRLESSFTTQNGTIPFASLTADGGEVFYGTTISDADNMYGGVYKFSSATGVISLRDSFTPSLGTVPYASLTAAGGGVYLGTTYSGGTDDQGGVYSFDSGTGTIRLLDSFTGTNGAYPFASLIAAGGGLFYGTTHSGGASDLGGVFAFDSGTERITLLDSFTGTNGANPLAALTPAGGDLYYGTVGHGGTLDMGGIYAFDSLSGTISLKASFTGSDGAVPHAPLTAAGGGLFCGTTRFGGASGLGVVFGFDSTTNSIILLDSFTGANGSGPYGALTAAGGDLYYGTTNTGGTHNLGTIFAFSSATGMIASLDSFTGANGAQPLSSLMAGEGGLYYGTTTLGGAENAGAIYSFNPVPGPLPILGAGGVLGWSRRLRQRASSFRNGRNHSDPERFASGAGARDQEFGRPNTLA